MTALIKCVTGLSMFRRMAEAERRAQAIEEDTRFRDVMDDIAGSFGGDE